MIEEKEKEKTMTDEYIKREAAYNAIVNNYTTDEQLRDLDRIPTADVVERKRGTWQKRMETSKRNGYTVYTPVWSCSNCGKDYDPVICSVIIFCYNCGAEMGE